MLDIERKMDIQAGDRVLVNVGPFIGSTRRSKDSVPCEVLEVDGARIRVATEFPFRKVDLWIQATWVDGRPEKARPLSEPSLA
jgi:hypothetical protein